MSETRARFLNFVAPWQTVGMMSTPLSKVRSQRDDEDDGGSADSNTSLGDEQRYAEDAADLNYSGDPGDVDEDIPPRIDARGRPNNKRSYAALPGRKRGARPVKEGGNFGSPMWRAVVSKPFFQAIVLAFAIICAVFMSPIASMISAKIPALSSLSCSETVLSALVSAILITATRPPPVGFLAVKTLALRFDSSHPAQSVRNLCTDCRTYSLDLDYIARASSNVLRHSIIGLDDR